MANPKPTGAEVLVACAQNRVKQEMRLKNKVHAVTVRREREVQSKQSKTLE